MLVLFPEGFAEEVRSGAVELVAFTDETGVSRLREAFVEVAAAPAAVDWDEEWKRFHVPAIVGSLWIGPPWEHPPSGLTPVVIDPGRAFGTGGHATTVLCLEFLQELDRASVLDLGCGSGVLAIAAAMLGFTPVSAVDAAEAAVEATRRNAELNRIELDVRQADGLLDALPAADIVLANLDLLTLAALASMLECRLAVTSGYYEREPPPLTGFRHLGRRSREEWAADLFTRE